MNNPVTQFIVTMGLVGSLMVIAISYYRNSGEASKASSSSMIVSEIGRANRMYSSEHSGGYAVGRLTSACNTQHCPAFNGPADPCNLVACKYVNPENWDDLPYQFIANDPARSGDCGQGALACAWRKNAKNCAFCKEATDAEPFKSWGYVMDTKGRLTPQGEAPELAER
ncbi:MAG: hypothetical protein HY077_06765 [Elusimicrobia bacterium]|nr:hypothetical protein [Elusimicrobiota bacterium]